MSGPPEVTHPTGLRVSLDSARSALIGGSRIANPLCNGHPDASGKPVYCRDLFVTKLVPDGGELWTRSIGDVQGYNPSPQMACGIAVDDGGFYLGGTAREVSFGPDASITGLKGWNILLLKMDNP